MTNLLHIAFVMLQLSEVKIQLEPESSWITNNAGQLTLPVGAVIKHEAHVGDTVKINWQPTNNVILQQSEDMSIWQDIHIRFINSSGWMAYPLGTRYYRLRSAVQ